MTLEKYQQKRDFTRTREPPAAVPRNIVGPLTFVIQKHSARRLHYDLRLEWDEVFKSWAVPKGPSLNPADKRLAAHVEDHPLDYGGFEGNIPRGSYGAGEVIVWDRGTYYPDEAGEAAKSDRALAEEAMRQGFEKGKLSFTLQGEKLRGSWTLVKLRSDAKSWLFIKHKDAYVDLTRDVTAEDRSIQSAISIEDLKAGHQPRAVNRVPVTASPKDLPGAKKAPFPASISPMLATLTERPFSHPDWIFEPKMDGVRAVGFIENGEVTLRSRRNLDSTHQYPGIAKEVGRLLHGNVVVDGELCALDERGVPSFERLQQRLNLQGEHDIRQAERDVPVIYYLFDLLYLDGYSLLGVPLAQRKGLLERLLPPSQPVRYLEHFAADGEDAYTGAVEMGLEGLVAKRRESLYEPGKRSKSWLKIKATDTGDFVVGGYTEGTGNRESTFGALLLGTADGVGKLKYWGQVGTGFDERLLKALLAKLRKLETRESPFAEKKLDVNAPPTFVKPELVAEVKFASRTSDGRLRAPVFLRLRDDKPAAQTRPVAAVPPPVPDPEPRRGEPLARPAARTVEPSVPTDASANADVLAQLSQKAAKLALSAEGHVIGVTNLDKPLWPPLKEGDPPLTKRDYLLYLTRMAPHILRYSHGRPLTLVRYPNGVQAGHFYQKHFEQKMPEFVETVRLYSDHNVADGDYILVNNLPTLLWLGQIADLELHAWYARVDPQPDGAALPETYAGSLENIQASRLNYPDFILFDLDPYVYSGKEKAGEEPELNRRGFEQCCQVAVWCKEMLDTLKLPCFVKTSGKTGLHVVVPIKREFDYHAVHSFAETIGGYLVRQHPKEVTTEWAVAKRPGKIFFDYNQNVRGKTFPMVYSARAAAGGPVSMPLRWNEVGKVYPTEFTMQSAPERVAKVGDLWAGLLEAKADLHAVLGTAAPPAEPAAQAAGVKRRKT